MPRLYHRGNPIQVGGYKWFREGTRPVIATESSGEDLRSVISTESGGEDTKLKTEIENDSHLEPVT